MPNEQDERDVLPDTTSGPPCDREVILPRTVAPSYARTVAMLLAIAPKGSRAPSPKEMFGPSIEARSAAWKDSLVASHEGTAE